MNDSRQFFSHSQRSFRPIRENPLAIKVGDIIEYTITNKVWTGIVVQTNYYNYPHMGKVQWLNDGCCGSVDLRECIVIARG